MAITTSTNFLTNAGKALSASQMASISSTPPSYIAIGSGASVDALPTNTGLVTEYTTGTPAARAAGTVSTKTTTVTNDTFQTTGTITAASSAVAVNEAGLFTAASAGTMAVSSTFPVVNLSIGDSITITAQIKYS